MWKSSFGHGVYDNDQIVSLRFPASLDRASTNFPHRLPSATCGLFIRRADMLNRTPLSRESQRDSRGPLTLPRSFGKTVKNRWGAKSW